jgi:hypothetical protein
MWKAPREGSRSDGPKMKSTDEDSTSLIVAIKRLSNLPLAGTSLNADDHMLFPTKCCVG